MWFIARVFDLAVDAGDLLLSRRARARLAQGIALAILLIPGFLEAKTALEVENLSRLAELVTAHLQESLERSAPMPRTSTAVGAVG